MLTNKHILFSLLFVAFSTSSFAQTVERVLDLPAIGWGSIDVHDVDTDANPNTTEYAVEGTDYYGGANTGLWRVVADRPNGLCIGNWFDPKVLANGVVSSVTLTGNKLVVKSWANLFVSSNQRLTIVSLDTPNCG